MHKGGDLIGPAPVSDNIVPSIKNANYYQGVYWNDYRYIAMEVNRRISGDVFVSWDEYFQKTVKGRRFKKALILNCGDGWVERALFAQGLFDEAVGVDFLTGLLEQARKKAMGLPLRYYQMDTNSADFPEDGYDLVVNYAAAHHNAYLNRIFHKIAELLPEDGCFVSYDYVGPHRNQYPVRQWVAALWLNSTLPTSLRQQMRYPHLPTMLSLDPTEAIHSELIVPFLQRYFHIDDYKHGGGALAYVVLTHNVNFSRASSAEQLSWLEHIMRADEKFLTKHPNSSLFDYILARPKKDILIQTQQLAQWDREELLREEQAKEHRGLYYSRTLVSRTPWLRGWE
jgi:SAM-dependent methyltransferase